MKIPQVNKVLPVHKVPKVLLVLRANLVIPVYKETLDLQARKERSVILVCLVTKVFRYRTYVSIFDHSRHGALYQPDFFKFGISASCLTKFPSEPANNSREHLVSQDLKDLLETMVLTVLTVLMVFRVLMVVMALRVKSVIVVCPEKMVLM